MGPESAPFTIDYNVDNALVPFVLPICLPSLFSTDTRPHTPPWYWLVSGASRKGAIHRYTCVPVPPCDADRQIHPIWGDIPGVRDGQLITEPQARSQLRVREK